MIAVIIHSDIQREQSAYHGDDVAGHVRGASGKGPKETLRQYVERTNMCFQQDNENVTMNETVKTICKTVIQQTRDYYRLQPNPVNEFIHGFRISAAETCRTYNGKDVELLVMVHSHPNNYEKRTAIRESWGRAAVRSNWPREKIEMTTTVVFVLALKAGGVEQFIQKESNEHKDIIVGDFNEHYHNMTLKSLLDFKWMLNYCSNAKYLLKSDDDMFINVPYLISVLKENEINMTGAIMGPYNDRSKVMRSGKWKLSEKEFPFSFLPPYESGAAYVIEASLVKPLFNASRYVPWMFIDDVYVTGILGRIIDAKHVKKRGFAYWNSKPPKACDVINREIITGTKQTLEKSRNLWREITNGVKCE